ncbi:LutC/YkgG family protein [Desertibaculum subflavum]|uniref:LutC/YkgG family protein n=1 Tax=Desertibaculum subflavum TaxID=2268458 RepID=UPI000E67299A
MSSGRDRILGAVRAGLGRNAPSGTSVAAVEDRIAHPRRNLVPARAQIPPEAQLELFASKAGELAATVERVASLAEVPSRVTEYLAGHNLPPRLKLSPDASLDSIPWADRPLLEIARGPATIDDATSVTPAFAAIAETGTLMLCSAPTRPTTLNFVPDNHIVVLGKNQVVGALEDAFARLRAARAPGDMPRAVNFVSGPSRTADIEQQLVMGAHGPRRLHIIVVDEPLA